MALAPILELLMACGLLSFAALAVTFWAEGGF